ncbi:MAG: sialidase family protein [Chloroflexota bacterium]
MTHFRHHPVLSLIAIVALAVVGLVPGRGISSLVTAAHASSAIAFGPTTVVEDQREGGEPDVTTCGPSATWLHGSCGLNNPYASAPYGFSTTSSWLWRSEDQARSYKLVPSNNTTGKPDACPGGGDTDLAVSPGTSQLTDYLNFIDLQGLTNFSTGVSRNGGQSFTCDPASSIATVVDRQWFGIYKNPAGAPSNGSAVYVDYDLVAGATCTGDPNADGNAFVVQKSTDGGLTYGPTVTADCNDGIAGNMQVNQVNGHVFAVHTAYSNPTATPSNPNTSVAADAVTVDRSTDGGATWQHLKVYGCTPTATTDCTTGMDFAVLAMDRKGNLYVTWSQAPTDRNGAVTGPSHIYYAYSSNEGTSWTAPRQVDHGATDVNLFPWIAVGNAGQVDIVWYGTTKASSVSSYDPGSQQSDWYPYLAQSLNATSSSASFTAPIQVSQHSNHFGGICTMGIGCTTGGDRSLADFFQVSINKSGGVDVIWTDTSNNSNTSASGNESGMIVAARQISGPTLNSTTLSGTATVCRAIASTPCQSDIKGDARYEANGTIGPNVPKLDITGSSVNLDPTNPSRLDVRMNLASLASLPNATDTGINAADTTTDYLTSWNYHVPGQTDAQYDATGNVFYAYLEVNRASGQVSAYDGDTCSIDSTKAKYFVYPGQTAVTYHINYKTRTIDLFVPPADVGNPASGAQLYSVTAHTVGQPAAAGPNSCPRDANGNPNDPSGKIFNVYDKSPAYTTILGTGTAPK